MLLDEKKTKRMVRIAAIVGVLAFGSVTFVVLAQVIFGNGCGNSQTSGIEQTIKDAEAATQERPRDPQAWEDLASAYASADRLTEAIPAAEKAVDLAPDDFAKVTTLVVLYGQNQQNAEALKLLTTYTSKHPQNAEAILTLAQVADQAGNTTVARLAYTRFLQLRPDDPIGADVRARLDAINNPTPTATARATTARATTARTTTTRATTARTATTRATTAVQTATSTTPASPVTP